MGKVYQFIFIFTISYFISFSQTVVVSQESSSNNQTYTGCSFDYYTKSGTFPTTTSNNKNITINFVASSGSCLSMTFFSFSLESYSCGTPPDYIQIYNGPNATGTLIGKYGCTNSPGYISSSTGTISVKYVTDGSGNASGWYAKVNCTCATLSDAISQDCSSAKPYCTSVGGTPASGTGSTADLSSSNRGCLTSNEKPGAWYQIVVQSSGTMKFALDPSSNHDYDFALWGPNKSCASLGSPIRCSYSAGSGVITGMSTANDNFYSCSSSPCTGATEDNTNYNEWTTELSVTANDRYYLFVGDYTNTAPLSGFQMTLAGSAGFSCDLTLPVELVDFTGYNEGVVNKLLWITSTEKNNDHFEIEKSTDALKWETIGFIKGKGNSLKQVNYEYSDYDFNQNIIYYRLVQVDTDGKKEYFKTISINKTGNPTNKKIIKKTNIYGEDINDSYTGIIIIFFEDGSYQKTYKN